MSRIPISYPDDQAQTFDPDSAFPAPGKEGDAAPRWRQFIRSPPFETTIAVIARGTLILALFAGIWWFVESSWIVKLAAVGGIWFVRSRRINVGNVFGAARFMTLDDLKSAGMIGRRGLLLGRYEANDFRLLPALKGLFLAPLAHSDESVCGLASALTGGRLRLRRNLAQPIISTPWGSFVHILTIAATGMGKGTGSIITNLLNYPGSVIVVDPKGENARITADHREAMEHRIVALDPWSISGRTSDRLNSLDTLDARSASFLDDCRALANALVTRTEKDHDPHWNDKGEALISAIVSFVAYGATGRDRSLNEVRTILSSKENTVAALQMMSQSDAIGGLLARMANQLLALSEKEFASVQSVANRHTEFLDSPLLMAQVAETTFDLRSIATRKNSIFIVVPPEYLSSHAGLIRLYLTTLMTVVKKAGASEANEILFIIDEFGQLGPVKAIEEAITLLRGYGVRVWALVQSVNQILTCYPEGRGKTLLANFTTQQYFGICDYETAEHVAKMLGKRTVAVPNQQAGISRNWSPGGGGGGSNRGRSFGAAERNLMNPDEILHDPDSVYLFVPGRYPVRCRKLSYYADPEFTQATADTPAGGQAASLPSYLITALGLLTALPWLGSALYELLPSRPTPQAVRQAPQPASNASEILSLLRSSDAAASSTTRLPPETTVELAECPSCHARQPLPPRFAGGTLQCNACKSLFNLDDEP